MQLVNMYICVRQKSEREENGIFPSRRAAAVVNNPLWFFCRWKVSSVACVPRWPPQLFSQTIEQKPPTRELIKSRDHSVPIHSHVPKDTHKSERMCIARLLYQKVNYALLSADIFVNYFRFYACYKGISPLIYFLDKTFSIFFIFIFWRKHR